MYRTGDPRFRRRLDEIGQTLESAQESAQTSIFQGYQTYIKPCFQSIGQTVSSCVEASCPTLNLTADQRERLRRQQRQGRSRGRAELNFDFYDDWEEDDTDALMGWGNNDEFDRLLAGSAGYGTVTTHNTTATQPARQRGMSYPKARRKSAADTAQDPTVIPGSSLFGKLFGGKALRYKPSAADLQDHPGVARHDLTEGEALLRESEGRRHKHRRDRSGTVASGHTTDSLSSRGDIFPSDGEDDAIPLDDEFAMVLERRVAGMETDTSSGRTRSTGGKRPSAGSRNSTFSSRRRADSSAAQSPVQERMPEVPSLSEMKEEERVAEREEEEEVARKRAEARRLAIEQGLLETEELSSKEATPEARTPVEDPGLADDELHASTESIALSDQEREDRS